MAQGPREDRRDPAHRRLLVQFAERAAQLSGRVERPIRHLVPSELPPSSVASRANEASTQCQQPISPALTAIRRQAPPSWSSPSPKTLSGSGTVSRSRHEPMSGIYYADPSEAFGQHARPSPAARTGMAHDRRGEPRGGAEPHQAGHSAVGQASPENRRRVYETAQLEVRQDHDNCRAGLSVTPRG